MKTYDRKIWDQKMKWQKSIWILDCPFCNDTDWLIIWQWKYLNIRMNKYPYKWMNNHLLLIPNKHVELTKDLTIQEYSEMKEAESFLSNYYKWVDYFSLIRQTNWWKSIRHLHYHYLPGKLPSSDLEKILK